MRQGYRSQRRLLDQQEIPSVQRASAQLHGVFNAIIQITTVQGHRRSKFVVPIDSPLMVCCLTSCKSIIVSVTTFEIYAAKIPDLNLERFKVMQGQSSWCQSIAHVWFPIRIPLAQSLYLSPFSQYVTCNFDDLKVNQLKVIQDQSIYDQSKAHWWYPI